MSEKNLGVLYAILAFLFWGGISPIYFKELENVGSLEVLAHRVIWSFVLLLPILIYQNQLKVFISSFKNLKIVSYLFASTILISINWLVFIWAIANERVLEASLGYYINPLVNVFLGYVFLKERMSKNQNTAIIIAFLAIVYEVILFGSIPYISLVLAFSFGIYGLIRKKIDLGSVLGLSIEIFLLLPFALFYIFYLFQNENLTFSFHLTYINILIIFGGLITITPLLLFNGAARRMKLSTLGFFQYIGPSFAFLLAIFLFEEEFSFFKLITFFLIWIALIIFSFDKILKK